MGLFVLLLWLLYLILIVVERILIDFRWFMVWLSCWVTFVLFVVCYFDLLSVLLSVLSAVLMGFDLDFMV